MGTNRWRGPIAASCLATLTVLGLPASTVAATADIAPDYLQDAGRTGHSGDDRVAPPLIRLWTHRFDNQLTYPLIVGDRVFVGVVSTGARDRSVYGDRVFALSLRTGRVLWRVTIPGPYYTALLAYDQGRVFVVNWNGVVEAFSASGGRLLWQTKAPGDHYADPPMALDGTLYLVSPTDNRLVAINERTGYFRWQVVAQTCGGSIAVDSRRVYLDGCGRAAAYSRGDGALVWQRLRPGSTPVTGVTRFGTELSTNDGSSRTSNGLPGGELVAAANGRTLGTFPYSAHPPVVAGALLILTPLDATHLSAIDTRGRSGAQRWSHLTRGQFGQPLVIGRDVFAMDGSRLMAYDGQTGAARGVTMVNPGSRRLVNELPAAPMASAEGYLVVPYESELSVYVSRFHPSSRGIQIGATPSVITYGTRAHVLIEGRLGSALRGHGRAALGLLEQAFARRQRGLTGGRPFADGGIRLSLRPPSRNTAFVVTAGSGLLRSSPTRVFVYPRTHYAFRYDRSTGTDRARVSLRFDPGIALPGRTGYLYLDRVEERRLFRLGRGHIRGSKGHGTLSVSFALPQHVTHQDRILWCVHRMTRLGLGAPGAIDSSCGSAQISYP